MTFAISCVDCGTAVSPDDGRALCGLCGGLLDYRYDLVSAVFDEQVQSIWRYRDLLPVARNVDPVTLGEGRTPLIRARLDVGAETWWKNEAVNPTGSQKDRAMSVALTRARAIGIEAVFVASAGSTALAAAAYAARAGIRCTVLVGEESSERRILPIAAYGAQDLPGSRVGRRRAGPARPGRSGDRAARRLDPSGRKSGPGRGSEDNRLRDRRGARTGAGLDRRSGRRRRNARGDPAWVR